MRRWRLRPVNPFFQRRRPPRPRCPWVLSSGPCTRTPQHQTASTHPRVELPPRCRYRGKWLCPRLLSYLPPGANDTGQAEGQTSPENQRRTADWAGSCGRRRRHPGQPQPARAFWGARRTKRCHYAGTRRHLDGRLCYRPRFLNSKCFVEDVVYDGRPGAVPAALLW